MVKSSSKQSAPGAGVIASAVAVSLLMLPSEAELTALAKAGRFAPVAPGQWRVVDLVQGYIRHLRETGTTRTTQEVAELCEYSTKMIQRLRGEGWIKPVATNRWELGAVLGGMVKFFRHEHRRGNQSAAEAEVRRQRAREIEIRVAERERRLIDIEEALAAVDALCGIVRTELAGLAARSARDVALRRVIDEQIHFSLQRLAEAMTAVSAALRDGKSLQDAVAGARGGLAA